MFDACGAPRIGTSHTRGSAFYRFPSVAAPMCAEVTRTYRGPMCDAPTVSRTAARLRGAHERARGRGVSRPLYAFARFVLTPALRVPLRIRVSGRDYIPSAGAAILAPNHKSFVDVFLVGLVAPRPVRFMAKAELF